MRKLLFVVVITICNCQFAICLAQEHRTLSVAEVLPSYGIDTAMVNDTAVALDYLNGQPQDYVALTNYCVDIRTKVQSVITNIESYSQRDSLMWIDDSTALWDYDIYEYRLRRLADFMGRMSIRYTRLEQERLEREREEARLRAEEEARRRQEALDREADSLKALIRDHHSLIDNARRGEGINDKNKIKDLNDLYYSYNMVYIKYDLSARHATEEILSQLHELNSFQNDVIDNFIGDNSLPSQIDNFKNTLKERCEKDKENYEVYRRYSRVFRPSVGPFQFSDLVSYERCIAQLRTIMDVQNRYLVSIDLRNTIVSNSDTIARLYGKKYRQVSNSYKETLRTVNLLPSFTDEAGSLNFIQELNDFIAAQQRYLEDYPLFEDFTTRSDSIAAISGYKDVISSYRDIRGALMPIPSFKNPKGASFFEHQMNDAVQVQKSYVEVIRLRGIIDQYDDSITAVRKVDRTLYSGYKLFRKQADHTPTFSTVERARSFIAMLESHINMQRLCMQTFAKRSVITANDDMVEQSGSEYRNIQKAYSRMMKVYDDFGDITNIEDLRRYSRMCDYTIEIQGTFLNLLGSEGVSDANARLYRVTDVEQIKAELGLR